MVAPRIIWRYIFLDVLQHSLIGLCAVTLLMVVQNALRFLEDLVGAGVGIAAMVELLGIILPSYFAYAIPTALVFGVLLTFGRMSLDGEIVALRASGVSVRGLLPPVLALGLLASASTAYLMAEVEPRNHHAMKKLVREMSKTVTLIEPGKFRAVHKSVLYAHARGDSDCPLRGVLIADYQDAQRPYYITSRCAAVAGESEAGSLDLNLDEGTIHFSEGERERYRRVRFASMTFSIDIRGAFDRRRARDFTTRELVELRPDLRSGEETEVRGSHPERAVDLQLHRRAAFPLASVLLSVISVALGIRPLRAGRSAGALTAVAIVAAYWVVSAFGESMGEEGYVPVAVGVWLPNALVLVTGVYLMRRVSRTGS